MKPSIKVIIVGLTLGVGFVGCSRDRDQQATGNTTNDTATSTAPATMPPNPVISSSDLENAVKAKLQSDDQLRTASINVNADADKKEVTLSGTVPSEELHSRAIDLAKSAQAGVNVNDKIDVKPAA